jgi:hypothetical protein
MGAWWLVLVPLAISAGRAEQPVSLAAAKVLPTTRIKVVFEVDGQLFAGPDLSSAPDASSRPQDLKAKGEFLYEERLAQEHGGRALRYYEQAEAELAIGGQSRRSSLRQDRRLVALDSRATLGESGFWSLEGPLTREELELIELPGSSHLVNQLLPAHKVTSGATWSHDDSILAQLLNLSGITVNEVSSQLKRVDTDRGTAHLTINGKVLGYASGVVTEIKLEGKYIADLRQQRVTWLALSIHEQRSPGVTKPGLDVQSRLRMLIEPFAATHLTAESLKGVRSAGPAATTLLEYQPAHRRFTLLHDRRWLVFGEQPDLTIMRLIEDGQVIAQCNLRSLAPQPGYKASLSQFQEEIRAALGAAAQEIVDADETVQSNGVRQLRVSIVGEVASAPIQWIYHQLTDVQGQVLTCVFTMSGENVERFGSEDTTLVSSVVFTATGANSAVPGASRPDAGSEENDSVARNSADALK